MRPIDEVRQILDGRLNTDDGTVLANQLAEIEAWGAFVSSEYRKAEKVLSDAKSQYWPQAGTVEARQVELAARVSDLQETVSTMKDMSEMIQRRISLGQTLLKSMRVEAEHGLR